jgi:hypothetical protein
MSLPTFESLETRCLYSASPASVHAAIEGSADLSQADYLGTFATHTSRSTSTFLGGSMGDQALYEVDIAAPCNLTVKLSNLKEKIQTQLLFSDGSPINSARNRFGKTEQFTQRLDPGTYYLNLITDSDSFSRVSISARSSKAPFGSTAPQEPSDNIVPANTGFNLTDPSMPVPTSSPDVQPTYVGTVPDGITPDPTADLQYMGGKTVQNMNFADIYVGANQWDPSDMQNIDSALASAMSDPTLNTVVQQYFSGQITCNFLGSTTLPGNAPASVSQDQIEAYITAVDKGGYLSGIDLNNTVLNFMLPSGTVLSQGADNSLNGLGGFHGSVHVVNQYGQTDTVYYAIGAYSEVLPNGTANGIPVFDQSWKNVVATFYHEMNEFRTDPDVEDANNFNDNSYCGWIGSQGEIGDYPIAETNNDNLPLSTVFCEVPLSDGSGTVPIQLLWSNQAHAPVDPTGGQAIDSTPTGNWWDWYYKFD